MVAPAEIRKTSSRYLLLTEKAAGILLLIYPTLMFSVKGGMNVAFLLMLLLALTVLVARPGGIGAIAWQRDWTIYAAAMAGLSTAILASQIYHQPYAAHPHDAAARYWLAIPVFLLLYRLRPNVISVVQYAFPIGAIAGFLLSKDMSQSIGRTGAGITTLDVIHFGDFELVLGIMSLFSINWFVRDKWPARILKIVGFLAGIAASIASGSRGGWLAIPVFMGVFVYFRMGRITPRMVAFYTIAAMLIVTVLYSFNPTVHQRVHDFVNDVSANDQDRQDSSTGARWQLYKAAVDVSIHHPIFGVGPEGFAAEMQKMLEAGKISSHAAGLGRAEVHNDILSKAAGMGIFGLVAILAIYFVPLGLFWRSTKSVAVQIKHAGVIGIVFVSGFFIFGLTVEILDLTMAAAFYSFTVAVLLAACYAS